MRDGPEAIRIMRHRALNYFGGRKPGYIFPGTFPKSRRLKTIRRKNDQALGKNLRIKLWERVRRRPRHMSDGSCSAGNAVVVSSHGLCPRLYPDKESAKLRRS